MIFFAFIPVSIYRALPEGGDVMAMTLAAPDSHLFDGRKYSEVNFAATHNSYSGGLMRDRASIREQLDRGVRALELDLHDDDYSDEGFRVGHLSPGDEVFRGKTNPRSDSLLAWMSEIAEWSAQHPDHAPLTVLLDLKDDLSSNDYFGEGDLFALNASVEKIFGAALFSADQIREHQWPTIRELRGKIIVVLSGDVDARIAYRGTRGVRPAVALNEQGMVAAVSEDEDGNLWGWSGKIVGEQVRWLRREPFASGSDASIAFDRNGLIRATYRDGNELYQQLGRLSLNGAIIWTDADTLGKRAIDERRDVAIAAGRMVRVYSEDDPSFGVDTLFAAVNRGVAERMRPAQLAFVEVQHGNDGVLAKDDLLFYSGSASDLSARIWATTARAAGKIARLWCFNDAALAAETSVNFPATDLLFSRWYGAYENTIGCAR